MELPFPELSGPHVAPRQDANTIPIIRYRLQSGAEKFNAMMLAREQRLLTIGPGNYQGIPLTPLVPNPDTGDSNHIVRISNDWEPEDIEVDLLFRDKNLYFTSFRRVENGVGVQWYSLKKEKVPDYLNAIEIQLNSSHESRTITTIGNIESLVDMWQIFANYEGGEIDKPLRRAKARAIVTFGEALRFLRVRREVTLRMEAPQLVAHPLSGVMWKTMQSWKVLCCFLVDVMRRLALPEGDPNRDPDQVKLASFTDPYDIHGLDDLTPPDGDIRVILSREELLISPANLQNLQNQPGAANVIEPGFPNEDEENPQNQPGPGNVV